MHLIRAGNDMNIVKIWLGHANINTTHMYVEIDMEMKRKALNTTYPPDSKANSGKGPRWQQPDILQWLDNLSQQVSLV